MPRQVVDVRYAKEKGYGKILAEIERVGKCPFCRLTHHDRPILKDHGSWILTKNFRPYKGSRYHFLLIRKKHGEQLRDLKIRDFTDIGWLLRWLERHFNLQGGGVALRFGKTRYTGATVCHLHCHVIVPKLDYRTVEEGPRKGRRERVARVISFPIG